MATRRAFLRTVIGVGGGIMLASCAPAAPSAPAATSTAAASAAPRRGGTLNIVTSGQVQSLDSANIIYYEERKAARLSVNDMQKVALGRSMIVQPATFLLEPGNDETADRERGDGKAIAYASDQPQGGPWRTSSGSRRRFGPRRELQRGASSAMRSVARGRKLMGKMRATVFRGVDDIRLEGCRGARAGRSDTAPDAPVLARSDRRGYRLFGERRDGVLKVAVHP